jgi:hypothetical protein
MLGENSPGVQAWRAVFRRCAPVEAAQTPQLSNAVIGLHPGRSDDPSGMKNETGLADGSESVDGHG